MKLYDQEKEDNLNPKRKKGYNLNSKAALPPCLAWQSPPSQALLPALFGLPFPPTLLAFVPAAHSEKRSGKS